MIGKSDIVVTINDVKYRVLCGLCRKPIAFVGEANLDRSQAGCTACRNTAKVEEISRITLDHAHHEMQIAFNGVMRDAVRNSKALKFSGNTTSNKRSRFTVDWESGKG